jgi:hypothetical protein
MSTRLTTHERVATAAVIEFVLELYERVGHLLPTGDRQQLARSAVSLRRMITAGEPNTFPAPPNPPPTTPDTGA